ncbi:HP1 family phage holin [Rhodanobacter aciditrophus]|uniref:Holin n=2 Tax=Gammaproteobacteria TaxID=1236 RepID=A0A370U7I0_9GAMM|nr:holin [Marinomonas piezotolerans]RDL43722.1 hypothetical protein DN730_13325 [Marinomonas piezotolerans]
MEKILSPTTYGGAFTAWMGSMTANDVAAYGGLVVAAATFAANVWYKRQHLKLAKEKLEKGLN